MRDRPTYVCSPSLVRISLASGNNRYNINRCFHLEIRALGSVSIVVVKDGVIRRGGEEQEGGKGYMGFARG